MYTRITATDIAGLMKPMSQRSGGSGVYFVRLCYSGPQILEGLWAYHEAARRKGVIIEGQISNPDDRQMSYLNDVLGNNFQPTTDFILNALGKWMPRMSPKNRREFA